MLTLHRAERTSTLVGALAEILMTAPSDPFARELVAVPAQGVERWLTQQLSTRLGATVPAAGDGIAANIHFPHPAALVDDVMARASGVASGQFDNDPWSTGRMLWTLLSVIDDAVNDPECAILARHLGHSADKGARGPGFRIGRRYGTAEHLTALFRGYGTHRPQMIIDWYGGTDTDGAGEALDPDQRWQAHLWRLLRERIDSPSPPERLEQVCATLVERADAVDLPERLSLFGVTRLSTEQLRVFAALATHRDINLFLPHASPVMWQKLRSGSVPIRRGDVLVRDIEHPLLASLSREVRELQINLSAVAADDVHHVDDRAGGGTHLERLQDALRTDRIAEPGGRADGSVQVHSCHGAARQVEVLRELVLRLFQDDPTLDPRDVIVMCPDVETHAPLIRAAFGQVSPSHPGHELRVRLADRALRQTNPLLDVMTDLLLLAGGRVKASEVLDLADTPPVRTRFGFGDDDLERLRQWTAESGARWGINDTQRKSFGLGGFRQNTFDAGLDRILLGVAADETELGWLDTALPLDDVDSADVELAGRFAEFISRLDTALTSLRGPRPATQWAENLATALDLLTAVRPADAWQRGQALRELASATEHGGDTTVRLADVRAMLSHRLAGRPTRANFRTGELTVCTMVPMRAVPHRVVILLGLDDESYPRVGGINGDDILARNPCVGERDIRSEDRQLLLDATMSAIDKLIVLYTGTDPVTGLRRPPAVPVGELLDTADAMLADDGTVLIAHPLHGFDPVNFAAHAPFSFDRTALAGARATQSVQVSEPGFLAKPLPEATGDVELRDLIAFVEHPMRAFCRQRLGMYLPGDDEELNDVLSADIDGLGKWAIGDRMLQARLSGVEADALRGAELRRGTLPPFLLGSKVFGEISGLVESLVTVAAPLYEAHPEVIDVTIDLGDGRRLTGTVPSVHRGTLVRTIYSRLAAKHRLASWVGVLALAASGADVTSSVVVGRGSYGRVRRSTLTAPPNPVAVLRQIVDLRDRGLRSPLPLPTAAAAEYADRRHRGDDTVLALDAADKNFGNQFGGDGQDVYVRYLHEGDFSTVVAERAAAEERDWDEHGSRFAASAMRLWTPLLDSEQVR
ncbi:exodeoxyribonuclease V subunit gamma [Nocardia sp. 348MFTsu5.1]|uniref:exodeoxyribonuclease V subunit gamma n=1 Tax=Nocardia sp. 348MFTsu5.1 TaxID=1172185 RepID=UPI000373F6ED|nr:exodeoxyribonuclease V subunit gamma [Nocardia sp. 348MFTsu5.1]